MSPIYFDNSATTYPKPPEVMEAMIYFAEKVGANPGRGSHQKALKAAQIILEAREAIKKLINGVSADRVIFTANATESLNLALKGLLQAGDHVIASPFEHNAVQRPLNRLCREGVEVSYLSSSPKGEIDPNEIKKLLKHNTRAVVLTHASNVLGCITPVAEAGKICREAGIAFIVDAAQSLGTIPVDVQSCNISLLAFTGHKGLYGPQGTGGLYIAPEWEKVVRTLKEGGTGGHSEEELPPEILPDKYESGTLNTIGIAGLKAGVEFVLKTGVEKIFQHEKKLTQKLYQGLKELGAEILGPDLENDRAPLISFNLPEADAATVSFMLDKLYDIATRPGLHCAPKAHEVAGTLERGAVRASFSYFNTEEEVEKFLEAIKEIKDEL
ncbi:cysteine desulfurase family protein [Carboxydothermus islandicus]|uniref:cysteine desulfurase n=1 Tax=Carboxydothermus islandicus TaxID=661089 RepID=A0A1L8CYU8_9THEO|nr:aminotransferase class V-fold PLP-dependent enzyme [Carboxydothermus islandicus]GAV24067.1 cysteine desulfurase family protein [Carboxydothermus islandicus]